MDYLSRLPNKGLGFEELLLQCPVMQGTPRSHRPHRLNGVSALKQSSPPSGSCRKIAVWQSCLPGRRQSWRQSPQQTQGVWFVEWG